MTNKEGLCICVDGTVKADGPCDDGNFQYSQENGMARLWSGKTDTDTNDAKKKYLLNKIAYKKAEKTNSLTDDIKKDLLKASAALEKRFTELYDAHTPNKNREKVLQGQHGHKNKEWKTTTPQRNRRTYYNALGTHGKIHHIFDAAEDELARLNAEAPPGPNLGENVATLDQLENLAADVLSKVTGCDSNDLKSQIREYHKEKGIHEDTLLRANAKGGQKADLKDNRTLGEKLDPKPGGLPTIPTDYTQKTTTEPNITPGKNMKDHLEHIYNYFELIPK